MKIVLIIALIIMIVYVGRGLSKYFVNRYKTYVEISDLIKKIELNISFEKDKLYDCVKKFSPIQKSVEVLVAQYKSYLKSGEQMNLNEVLILTFEEKNKISEMLVSLGKSDAENELKKIQNIKQYFDEKTLDSKTAADKFAPVCTKLGLLLALILAVLLI